MRAVLAVRLKDEEREEHRLTTLGGSLRQARIRHADIAEKLAAARASRLNEVECRADGAQHQRWDAEMKNLRQRYSDAAADIETAERTYAEQMQRFLATRRAREVISELEQRNVSRWRAELQVREQKRYDELFLARFVRE
jgi:flagellar biosynthesis chaperone FliJ